jgi:putative hydrolase of the HAD superfamily
MDGGIFDVGGVLIDNIFNDVMREASKYYQVSEKKIRGVFAKLGHEFDTPWWTVERYCNMLGEELGVNKPPRDFWTPPYERREPRADMMGLVGELKDNGYKLAVISNAIPPHVEINERKGIYDPFDVRVISCETDIGLKKPEKRIYQHCLHQLGEGTYFFVDDMEENLPPARELGIHAIHFKNYEQVREEIKKLGVRI